MATRAVKLRAGAGVGIAAGVLAGVLAACSGGGSSGSASSSMSSVKGTKVNASLKDFTIGLSTHNFKAGDYTFVAKNNGPHQHSLEVEGPGVEKRIKVLDPGQSANLVVKLKSGTYKVYCPVDHHQDLGMKQMIKVGAGSSSGSTSSGGSGGY